MLNNSEDRDMIAIGNTQGSPLLKLPAEIRNEICAYALNEPTTKYVFDTMESDKEKDRGRHCLALLATCRQLHTETKELPFELNTPSFESLVIFETVCDKMPPATRSLIKCVELKDITYKTVGSFLESMKGKGFITLRHLLPNLRSVKFISLKKPGDCGTGGPWDTARRSQRSERNKLGPWLHGEDDQIEVNMVLPKYSNGVVGPRGEIVPKTK